MSSRHLGLAYCGSRKHLQMLSADRLDLIKWPERNDHFIIVLAERVKVEEPD